MLKQLTLALGLALLLNSTASAHVVFAEPQAAPGAYYAGFLRISHGCGDSPTLSVRVEIPANVLIARPQPKPGWTLDIQHAPLAEPIQSEGGYTITERVTAITWTGALPSDQFDQFGIMMRLPPDPGALHFPVLQTCATGEQRWDQIAPEGARWNSVSHPAAVLTLIAPDTPSEEHAHHH